MDGCPVNVRLLDPPLHEFVPHDAKGQEEMAKAMGVTVQAVSYTHLPAGKSKDWHTQYLPTRIYTFII